MSKRSLIVALTISLLFNIAVLIGFMQSRASSSAVNAQPPLAGTPAATAPSDQPFLQRLANELRLDASQSGELEGLRKRQRQQAIVFTDSMTVVRQDLAEELRRQQPDLEKVRTLVDQEAELMRQRRLAEADLYGEFVGLLSPEQRQRLSEHIAAPLPPPRQQPGSRGPAGGGGGGANGGGGGPPPQDIVRRFDRNGNGRLDPDEMQEARRELEARRREVVPRGPQRPAIWPWFDADGDGQLNDAERADFDKFIREHHAPNPSGQQPQPMRPGIRNGERRGGNRGPDIRPGEQLGEPSAGQPMPDQPPPNQPPPHDDPPGDVYLP